MHGARGAAWEYIQPYLKPEITVLDVCCGEDPWLRSLCSLSCAGYLGMDQCSPHGDDVLCVDLSRPLNQYCGGFNLAVTVYGLQHLQNGEAQGWLNVHRSLRDDGQFIYIGSLSPNLIPFRNTSRQDPCNVHSIYSLKGVALATGFEVMGFSLFTYDPAPKSGYSFNVGDEQAMAFAATLRKRP